MPARKAARPRFALAVHGGAGTIDPADMTRPAEQEYRSALAEALRAGYAVLRRGGAALDAVEAAVVVLEECPLFNAGRGAVLTAAGRHEMDASVMDGANLAAGAVTCVETVRNPVRLARRVMEKTPHVLLAGRGAETFAAEQGLERKPVRWFTTPLRRQQWLELRGSAQTALDHGRPAKAGRARARKLGTVGAVACDKRGHVAAATSTGGMTNKRVGRVGDTPLVGAGTWADDRTCAVSATGHGEYMIRTACCHDIACLMEYKGWPLARAAEEVIGRKLPALGGDGGVIAVDARGNLALPFNTPGMYRGWVTATGAGATAIYHDDERPVSFRN